MEQKTDSSDAHPSSPIDSLPREVALEIAFRVASSSASNYRTLLLISRRFHAVARVACLAVVPVALQRSAQLASFERLLRLRPELRAAVRHLVVLWINSPPETELMQSIVRMCTGVVNLFCLSQTLLSTFAAREPTSEPSRESEPSLEPEPEPRCTSLTLFSMMPTVWRDHMASLPRLPKRTRYFAHVSHLFMWALNRAEWSSFPLREFASLTHLAFRIASLARDEVARPLAMLAAAPPGLRCITAVLFAGEGADPALEEYLVSDILDLDRRLSIVHCREGWSAVAIWKHSVRGGPYFWDPPAGHHASMYVYRRKHREAA